MQLDTFLVLCAQVNKHPDTCGLPIVGRGANVPPSFPQPPACTGLREDPNDAKLAAFDFVP